MCSLNLKSKQNSCVCDHRAVLLSLPPFPATASSHHVCRHMCSHTVLTRTHNACTDTHINTHTLTPSLALPCQYLFFSGIIFLDVFFVVLSANHPHSQDPGIFSQDVEIPDIFAQRDKSKCTLGLMETVSFKPAINFTLPPPCQKKSKGKEVDSLRPSPFLAPGTAFSPSQPPSEIQIIFFMSQMRKSRRRELGDSC